MRDEDNCPRCGEYMVCNACLTRVMRPPPVSPCTCIEDSTDPNCVYHGDNWVHVNLPQDHINGMWYGEPHNCPRVSSDCIECSVCDGDESCDLGQGDTDA